MTVNLCAALVLCVSFAFYYAAAFSDALRFSFAFIFPVPPICKNRS